MTYFQSAILENNPFTWKQLDMTSEARYQEKIRFLQGQNLYHLKNGDSRSDIKLPAIEFGDIYNFLVILTSF